MLRHLVSHWMLVRSDAQTQMLRTQAQRLKLGGSEAQKLGIRGSEAQSL
jgi:hypothetical protein